MTGSRQINKKDLLLMLYAFSWELYDLVVRIFKINPITSFLIEPLREYLLCRPNKASCIVMELPTFATVLSHRTDHNYEAPDLYCRYALKPIDCDIASTTDVTRTTRKT